MIYSVCVHLRRPTPLKQCIFNFFHVLTLTLLSTGHSLHSRWTQAHSQHQLAAQTGIAAPLNPARHLPWSARLDTVVCSERLAQQDAAQTTTRAGLYPRLGKRSPLTLMSVSSSRSLALL